MHETMSSYRAAVMWVAVMLVALASGGCGDSAATPRRPATSLQVGYIPIAECLPLYVAKEMGFFEKRGLTVEMTPLGGGADILKGVSAGQFDVGFSNVVSLVLNRVEGQQLVSVVGSTYETERNQNHAIYVRAQHWKPNVGDCLRGKLIAVNTRRNIEDVMLASYLQSFGVKPDEYRLQEVKFPDMLQQLEAGTIDAACLVEPFITAAGGMPEDRIRRVGNHYLVGPRTRTIVATYVSSEQTLAKKDAALNSFVLSMEDATRYIAENESKARDLLPKYAKMSADQAVRVGLPEFGLLPGQTDLAPLISEMESRGLLSGKQPPKSDELIWRRR